MLRDLWNLRRSLFVQITGLSLGILLLIFAQFGLLPVWSQLDNLDPVAYTRQAADSILGEAAFGSADTLAALDRHPDLARIRQSNPEMRIFVQNQWGEFSQGGAPHRFEVPASQISPDDWQPENGCRFFPTGTLGFEENGRLGRVIYTACPANPYYIEVAGIENAAFSQGEVVLHFIGLNASEWFNIYLYVTVGVLLVSLFTIFQAVRSLRKLEGVAKRINLGGKRTSLPEEGLPKEVEPLVRSLNEMLHRIEAAHEKQAFFLAAAAHELRTPLTILRTRLEELEQTELKEDLRKDVRKMSSLVEQLLKLTKLNATEELTMEPMNLGDIVQDVLASRAITAMAKDVDIELVEPDDAVQIRGDRSMVETAIANLVDNAISYSKSGDPLLVTVFAQGIVEVADNGPGVPPSRQTQVFEPFAKSPPNRVGHGLGLAIVDTIMKLHLGRVKLRNGTSGGAVFSLDFSTQQSRAKAAS